MFLLVKLGGSLLANIGKIILLPLEHSTSISSSNVHKESGANRILYEALRPGAITDCP